MPIEDQKRPKTVDFLVEGNDSFLSDIARYFRDFLDTDFRRQRLPKRQISRLDRQGNVTGISLKKYPTLIQKIWSTLDKPIGAGVEFEITRGRYQAKIDKSLADLIEKYISAIKSEDVNTLNARSKDLAHILVKQLANNPEQLRARVISGLERELKHVIILPLLQHLESYFSETNVQGLETIFDIEDELGNRLVANSEEAIGASLNTAIVSKDFSECDGLIEDLFNLNGLKAKIRDYFEAFTASDFYTELHSLRSTLKIYENMEVYLYVGDLHFGHISYPLFYLPLRIELNNGTFKVSADPHLYINKKAIDYVAQEIARAENKAKSSLVKDRIIYLEPKESFVKIIQDLSDGWAADLALHPPIDFAKAREQKARSSQVVMTNRLYFSTFDKSDESLLNDYEALLTMAEGGDEVLNDFQQLISGFLSSNPKSVTEAVDTEWQQKPIQDRLVYRSVRCAVVDKTAGRIYDQNASPQHTGIPPCFHKS